MTKVNVYGINGSEKEQITLPKVFDTTFRPDIIRKSFNVLHTNKRQPYGSDPIAGMRHASASVGKGRGMSRVPRLTQGRAAALVPSVVGGRRAHPPKAERNWEEKINKKERILARRSALAATANKQLVAKRGHKFKETMTLPIVVEDGFGDLIRTKDVIEAMEKLGVYDDVLRAKDGKHIRAGRGKSRGRKYKTPTSVLIVSQKDFVKKGSENLPGVQVIAPSKLNIEHLAPGGESGRLVVITRSSLAELGGEK
ncbi:MAG: 50S ribosomal protein L4 [Thermoplasmatota archaeon]